MWRLKTAIVVALLGPFQYGIALVVVNTMLESLSEDLGFDKNVGGAVASAALYLGAGVGGLLTGLFQMLCGKYSQVWIGIMYAAGSMMCGFTTDDKICWGGPFDICVAYMVVAGRTLTGLASGLMLVISPKYLADVSPPSIRGALGASTQLCIAIGVFSGLLIGLPYEFDSFDIGYDWWRVMFLISALPAILQSVLTLPTLPLYESSNEDLRSSFKVGSIQKEIDIEAQVPDMANENNTDSDKSIDSPEFAPVPTEKPLPHTEAPINCFKTLFQGRYRRCVILGVGVPVVCQLIGVGITGAYSTTIFKDAGLDQAIIGSILYGLSNVLASGLSVVFFDRLGRTTMATISFSGMGFSYVAIALSDLAPTSISGPLSVVFLITFIFSFGAGCGALNVSYAPEVVPPELADIVLGTGQSMSVFVALLLVLVFPSVLDALGALGSFFILAGFSFGSLLFLKVFMIETKGRELDDIIQQLAKPK